VVSEIWLMALYLWFIPYRASKRHPLMGYRGRGSKIESLGSEEREEER